MRDLKKPELNQINGGKALRVQDYYDPNCGREEGCQRNPVKKIKTIEENVDPLYFYQNI